MAKKREVFTVVSTTVKEPAEVFVNVPKPVKAPVFAPRQVPVEQPAERELVPVRVAPAKQQSRL